jgi:hypothetical protein
VRVLRRAPYQAHGFWASGGVGPRHFELVSSSAAALARLPYLTGCGLWVAKGLICHVSPLGGNIHCVEARFESPNLGYAITFPTGIQVLEVGGREVVGEVEHP